jgi:hypothetical protein
VEGDADVILPTPVQILASLPFKSPLALIKIQSKPAVAVTPMSSVVYDPLQTDSSAYLANRTVVPMESN